MKKTVLIFLIFTCVFKLSFAQFQPWLSGTGGVIYYNSGGVSIGSTAVPTGILFNVNGAFQSTNFLTRGQSTFAGLYNGIGVAPADTNTVYGYGNVPVITTGSANTVFGSQLAPALTTGSRNIIIGSYYSGWNLLTAQHLTTGHDNVLIGYGTGGLMTTASQNVGIGDGALEQSTGSSNVAVGFGANGGPGAGSFDAAYGTLAGQHNTSGNNNVYIGWSAGGVNATGSNLTFLGYNAGTSVDGLTNATAIGYNAQVTANNCLVLGSGVNVGIGTTSPKQLLQLNSAAGTTPSQFDITANNQGALSALNLGIDNAYIGLDADYSGSSWTARSTSAAWLYKNSGQLKIMGATGTNGSSITPVQFFTVNLSTGNVTIGAPDQATYKFAVGGNAIANSFTIKNTANWPDYVFANGYELPSLPSVEAYVNQNHHLPNVPSAEQLARDGVNIGEINKLLVKKVEELTLYIIERDKKEKEQEARIAKLEAVVTKLTTK